MAVKIASISAIEVLNSSGLPALRATVTLDDGSRCWAIAPTGGMSAGPKEAVEVRDHDINRYGGFGLLRALASVSERISPSLIGQDPLHQAVLDRMLIDLDGTPNKSKLGANVILAISMAIARAGALVSQLPLYVYLGGPSATSLPMPMVDILNGGVHADNSVDFEEFMVVPVGAKSFSQAIRMCAEIFQSLKRILIARGHRTGVGEQGGFAPNLYDNEKAFELILEAIRDAGYRPGDDVALAIDVAAGRFYNEKTCMYELRWSGKWSLKASLTRDDMIGRLGFLIQQYPIVSIEDGLMEDDLMGFASQMRLFGSRTQIVGDDLYATHDAHIRGGIAANATNAVVIRLSQVGTVSEAISAVHTCRQAGWAIVIADCTADSEDTFTADFAVAMGAGQIKCGSTCRGERVAKYNRLLEIESELGGAAVFQSPLRWSPMRIQASSPRKKRPNGDNHEFGSTNR